MANKSPKKSKGHAEHTKSAKLDTLRGVIPRPIKITMLGAGSGFTPRLVSDVLNIPGAETGTIALVDVDQQRLTTMHALIRKLVEQTGKIKWNVIASKDRTEVLGGSDYIVNCIEV